MADRITTTAAYTASGATFIFGMSLNEAAAAVGIAFTIGTFVVNFWFKYQHLKLARQRHAPDCITCTEGEA